MRINERGMQAQIEELEQCAREQDRRITELEADKQRLLEDCDALRAAGLAAMQESGRLEKENAKLLDALAWRFYPDGVVITDEMRERVRAFVLDERYKAIENI